jgi:hypothetical protein
MPAVPAADAYVSIARGCTACPEGQAGDVRADTSCSVEDEDIAGAGVVEGGGVGAAYEVTELPVAAFMVELGRALV